MSFTSESSGHIRCAYRTAKGDREGNGEAVQGRGWKAHLGGRTARLLGGRLQRRRGGRGRSEPHAPFSPARCGCPSLSPPFFSLLNEFDPSFDLRSTWIITSIIDHVMPLSWAPVLAQSPPCAKHKKVFFLARPVRLVVG
jgi:hypothetical protein